jgi:hypothetical protein
MSQTRNLALALMLVSSLSLADDRLNTIEENEAPKAVYEMPNPKTGVLTAYALDEIDPRVEALAEGKLTEAEIKQLQEDTTKKALASGKKIGEVTSEGGRVMNSSPACAVATTLLE